MFEKLQQSGWAIEDANSGLLIAEANFDKEMVELTSVLGNWEITVEDLIQGGGWRSKKNKRTQKTICRKWVA